jgi:hypothetical protein
MAVLFSDHMPVSFLEILMLLVQPIFLMEGVAVKGLFSCQLRLCSILHGWFGVQISDNTCDLVSWLPRIRIVPCWIDSLLAANGYDVPPFWSGWLGPMLASASCWTETISSEESTHVKRKLLSRCTCIFSPRKQDGSSIIHYLIICHYRGKFLQ